MAVDLERTMDLDLRNPDQNDSGTDFTVDSINDPRVRLESQDGSTDRLKTLFDESTRQLLRERLIIASVILATTFAVVQLLVWLNGMHSTTATLARIEVVVCLFGVVLLLKRRASLSFKTVTVAGDFCCGCPFVGNAIRSVS